MPRGGSRSGSGRKAQPTRLKVLHGSKKAKRQAKIEPVGELGEPERPHWLGPVAVEVWSELAPMLDRMRVLSVSDRIGLEMLSAVYAEWRAAHDVIEKGSATQTITTPAGDRKEIAHPAVAQRSDAFRRLHSLVSEFGLTPASRTKLRSTDKPEARDPLEELIGRRA